MAAESQDEESRRVTHECADAERAKALVDDQLDEALEGTFPASDPVSFNMPNPRSFPGGECHGIPERDRTGQARGREGEGVGGRKEG